MQGQNLGCQRVDGIKIIDKYVMALACMNNKYVRRKTYNGWQPTRISSNACIRSNHQMRI